jgi:hypothetical protein
MHLDDGLLAALVDDELDAAATTSARNHLAACTECHKRYAALLKDDAFVNQSLAALDRETSVVPVGVIVARARRSGRVIRWAAAVGLFLVAAGGLYALPGSPLRRWIASVTAGNREQVPTPPRPSGIAVEPGTSLRIVFAPPSVPSNLMIALTEGAMVDARRLDGTARFTAEIDRLLIEPGNTGGDFAIDLPRTAPRIEILVGTRRILLKDGLNIVTEARPDSLGRYIVRLP